MFDHKLLAALAAVIDQQSFEKAAQTLFITQGAISQRIKQLEQQVGQALVIRQSPNRATETGLQLLKHFNQVSLLQDELAANLKLQQNKPFGKIRIAVNADSLATWFLDAIKEFTQAQNRVVDLVVDDQDVTHEYLKTGQVMGCVSAFDKEIHGAVMSTLGTMRYISVASPEYIHSHFTDGVNRESLRRAPAAVFNHKDELTRNFLQHFELAQSEIPFHTLPSAEAFVDIAIKGLAFTVLPEIQVEKSLQNGDLINISPNVYIDVPLYWHCWAVDSQLTKSLTEILTKGTKNVLRQG